MKIFFYLSVIMLCCSCNSEKKESTPTVAQTPGGLAGLQKNAIVPTAESTKSTLIYNPAHGKPGHTCALAVGAPLAQTAVAQPQKINTNITALTTPVAVSSLVNTPGKKLNPKHGEPGHRCDIAVGAPLDAKPVTLATTSKPKVTQQPPIKVAKGMNPPHGQPNHRCDIAVGAPLNSKAISPQPVTVKTPEVTSAETKAIETTQTGAKLNPKHGDPGHRCDIAVGAPLT